MLKNNSNIQEKPSSRRKVLTGAVIGGTIGAAAVIIYKTGAVTIPGMGYILTASPLGEMLTGTALGAFIGAGINSLGRLDTHKDEILRGSSPDTVSKLKLREEQLDISKKLVETGEVTMHKDVWTEDKSITVPVTHEELVIEKKLIDPDAEGEDDAHIETIRIPISEERIEVIKHPEILNDVRVYTRQYQETEHIEETLLKEQVNVETKGEAKVIEIETERERKQAAHKKTKK